MFDEILYLVGEKNTGYFEMTNKWEEIEFQNRVPGIFPK